ncbi:hypothetical protein [Arthrospiribacter ruber]|uniref:Thioredoxin domain-containing protein n=1 Tax=Arthrospiribacter ruber TaxID=2487934 RepID=A0A951IVR2_9BACT|nr:hypothetical protein [Arthrospiribacter ruber]MBW3466952.1 hypothetical protein [Arthrospiribacter ruber]
MIKSFNSLLTFLLLLSLFIWFCKPKRYEVNQLNDIQSLDILIDSVILPDSLILYRTIYEPQLDVATRIRNSSKSMVIFINASCVTCIQELDFWIENEPKFQEFKIPFFFIARAQDEFHFFKFVVENEGDSLPKGEFYFDTNDEFRLLNNELLENGINTILINSRFEVLFKGNPIKDKAFLELLSDQIKP